MKRDPVSMLFTALAVTGRLARVPVLPLLAGLVVYSGLPEVLQALLPIDRDGDVRDALADVVGALVGLAAFRLATRSRAR